MMYVEEDTIEWGCVGGVGGDDCWCNSRKVERVSMFACGGEEDGGGTCGTRCCLSDILEICKRYILLVLLRRRLRLGGGGGDIPMRRMNVD